MSGNEVAAERRETSGGSASSTDPTTAGLRGPHGGFTMVALDQRESLRRMFPLVGGQEVGDEVLRGFKTAAESVLAPLASAILLDRPLAVRDGRPAEIGGCPLILAADELDQPPGRGVVGSGLDAEVTPDFVRSVGAAAVKLLVIWRPDGRQEQRADLVGRFLELARRAGVVSLVEGIVRPATVDDWPDASERHAAILDAAKELSALGADIYKAEVPGYVPGDLSEVQEQAARLSELVPGPWVVLSNGVASGDFPDAVAASVAGGASGFLAGRAIWADTVTDPDPEAALRDRSTARLRTLTDIVRRGLRR
ncbi:aldolase [Nakamurella endophytica]|uniref:Aldolase n=1 Tax=Nakamurella endophytica TaxID=1748367 RepID=A0A917SV03_9ACTN|nr:aldolase [Nakamurella endophytica]GGL97799.1 aldolase [Nakamurella endophytica]